MSFTSINFLLFVFVVVVINYILTAKKRWILLLLSSYYFYLNWQPVYAILLFFTSVVTYVCSVLMNKGNLKNPQRKAICVSGCLVPLSALIIFKYYNFFTDSIIFVLDSLGIHLKMPELSLLMPVGISFYTFTSVGYLIDIYKRRYAPETNFGIVCLFVSFFAQISSGPIPRGNKLIPQLKNPEPLKYENVIGGFKTMMWGFFMKLCVADRVGIYVDSVYNNMFHHNGGSMLLASFLYTIQIYCDFAGYSLVAIGTARMLGIRLMDNFRRPYFASSIKDFWSRWHISLSTWFRDYVYIPLGGSRVSKKRNILNLLATFLISGLWHGAAWNFLLWGGFHGVGQSIEKISTAKTKDTFSKVPAFFKIFLVFVIVNFLWVFFRLQSMKEISNFFVKIITDFGIPFIDMTLVYGMLALVMLFIKDVIDEYCPSVKLMSNGNIIVSSVATGCLVTIVLLFGVFDSSSFIYFQF